MLVTEDSSRTRNGIFLVWLFSPAASLHLSCPLSPGLFSASCLPSPSCLFSCTVSCLLCPSFSRPRIRKGRILTSGISVKADSGNGFLVVVVTTLLSQGN